ncbi:MAG: hypothetical protein RDV41_03045 [Planctomycetota bacterium]|nr:hypothetical protein [Planctomycetota bacterium]
MDATGPEQSVSAGESAPGAGAGVETLSWTAHPLRDYPSKSVILVLVMITVGAMTYFWVGTLLMTLFWIGLCLILMARYFLPTRYTLTAAGIEIRFLGRTTARKWTDFRNFYVHDTGTHLSPFPSPSGLDPFRGHYVLYGKGNKDAVVSLLKTHISRPQPR